MANSLVTGALNLSATCECISVSAVYTGDDNGDATAVVEYKESASGTWLPAYTPYIDRRGGTYDHEARVSIVGLTENTSYDVRITWTDPDTVSGTNPVSGSITTYKYSPILTGSDYWASVTGAGAMNGSSEANANTLAGAMAAVSPGDTIKMVAGTYAAFTASLSGSLAGGHIKFEAQGSVTISGSATDNIQVNGDYLWFEGLTFASSNIHAVDVSGGANDIIVDTCTMTDIGATYSLGSARSGVNIQTGAVRVWVLNCSMDTDRTETGDSAWVYGIHLGGGGIGGHIFKGNTITASGSTGLRDGIGGGGNIAGSGFPHNSDCINNTITNGEDDGIEFEGDNRNCRMWGNNISNFQASLMACAPVLEGPCYIFRNVLHSPRAGGAQSYGVKLGNNSRGPAYFFHNVISTIGGGDDVLSDIGGDPKSDFHHYRNNIFQPDRYAIYRGLRNNTYDYNLYDLDLAAALHNNDGTGPNYANLAAFQAGEVHEDNGVEGSANLDGSWAPIAGSPAIDVGTPLDNFNGANSAWPITGIAPDIGAYEYIPVTTNYYVDNGRTANGDGSEANPWKLWSDINWGTVTSSLALGDVNIYFSSRATWASGSPLGWTPGSNGSATATLALIGDEKYNTVATGTAVWQAETVIFDKFSNTGDGLAEVGTSNFVLFSNAQYITFKGFHLNGPTWGAVILGELLPSTGIRDILIENVYMDCKNSSPYGMYSGNTTTGSFNFTVRGCRAEQATKEALYFIRYNHLTDSATGMICEDNVIVDCGSAGEGDIDIKPGCFGAIIRNNHHFNTGAIGILASSGVVIGSNNTQVYGNVFYNLDEPITWCDGIFLNADGADGTGKAVTSCLIYNNVIYGNRYGINCITSFGEDLTGVKIFNNSVHGNRLAGIRVNRSSTGTCEVEIKNNISANNVPNDIQITGTMTADIDYNLYYRTSGNSWNNGSSQTWAQWQALGHDANGIQNSNPLWVSTTPGSEDLHLTSGSPADGAGVDLSGTFTVDLDGVARTVPWDMGAYVFGVVVNTPVAFQVRKNLMI